MQFFCNRREAWQKEKKYKAIIKDISAGGAKLLVDMPIKNKQKLWMNIELPDGKSVATMGIIVDMHKEPGTDLYALHISFFKIPLTERNKILADIYKYD